MLKHEYLITSFISAGGRSRITIRGYFYFFFLWVRLGNFGGRTGELRGTSVSYRNAGWEIPGLLWSLWWWFFIKVSDERDCLRLFLDEHLFCCWFGLSVSKVACWWCVQCSFEALSADFQVRVHLSILWTFTNWWTKVWILFPLQLSSARVPSMEWLMLSTNATVNCTLKMLLLVFRFPSLLVNPSR